MFVSLCVLSLAIGSVFPNSVVMTTLENITTTNNKNSLYVDNPTDFTSELLELISSSTRLQDQDQCIKINGVFIH